MECFWFGFGGSRLSFCFYIFAPCTSMAWFDRKYNIRCACCVATNWSNIDWNAIHCDAMNANNNELLFLCRHKHVDILISRFTNCLCISLNRSPFLAHALYLSVGVWVCVCPCWPKQNDYWFTNQPHILWYDMIWYRMSECTFVHGFQREKNARPLRPAIKNYTFLWTFPFLFAHVCMCSSVSIAILSAYLSFALNSPVFAIL